MSNDPRKTPDTEHQHHQQSGGAGHGAMDRQHEQAGGKMGQAGGQAGGTPNSGPARHETGRKHAKGADPKGSGAVPRR